MKSKELDEIVKATGVDYIETSIRDSKSIPQQSETDYLNNLYDNAMLSEDVFNSFCDKSKIDWEHIKEVINLSETKYNRSVFKKHR